ncbi:MAG: hypothetical protein JXA99_17595 [Candidatus Lokiarchaeota archaeon]|nr:hypothetical protein [Candidatus Lokiarchaeota archaeon]
MEVKDIIKKLRFFGGYFFLILLIFETIFFFLLITRPITLDGATKILFLYIFDLNVVDLSTTILWIFLFLINIYLFIQAILLIKLSPRQINDKELLKNIFLISVLTLLIIIIKVNLIYQLQIGNYKDSMNELSFIELIQDKFYVDLYVFVLWIIFISPNCYQILYYLIISAVALKEYLIINEIE